jgi:hypothetical protein
MSYLRHFLVGHVHPSAARPTRDHDACEQSPARRGAQQLEAVQIEPEERQPLDGAREPGVLTREVREAPDRHDRPRVAARGTVCRTAPDVADVDGVEREPVLADAAGHHRPRGQRHAVSVPAW